MAKRKRKKYLKGIYRPKNPKKYLGTQFPIYRSSWELKFNRFCDLNPNVIKWGAETVKIPYISPIDNKMHQYFIDHVVFIKEGNNEIQKYLIEIKPKKQLQPPTDSKRKKQSTLLYEQATYAVNQAKWNAAKQYCNKYGLRFQILTQDELNIKTKY